MSIEDDIEEAAERFADFHGEEPDEIEIEEISEVAFAVGKIEEITYTIIEDGKEVTYRHDFKDQPTLAVSDDGLCFYGLRGGYRFTQRGFEDD